MSDIGMEDIMQRERANHIERLRRLYELVRRWPAARRRGWMSQYHTWWKIWAMVIVGCGCTANAHASFGTLGELDQGVKNCIDNKYLRPLGDGTWGGDCSIRLSGQNSASYFDVPSAIETEHANEKSRPNLVLLSTTSNAGSWSKPPELQIGDSLILNCHDKKKGTWPANTRFTLGVQVASPDEVSTVDCSYAALYAPHWPEDTRTSDGNRPHNGFLTYTPFSYLYWSIKLPLGATLYYPSLILVAYPSAQTRNNSIATLGVGTGNSIDPTPQPAPIAGDVPNCSLIGAEATFDLGTASSQNQPGMMKTTHDQIQHISLACNSGSYGSRPITVSLYAQTTSTLSNDRKHLLTSASDWLGLGLKLESKNGPTLTIAPGQISDTDVVWSIGQTLLWTWSVGGSSSAMDIPLSSGTLHPHVDQLTEMRGTKDGQRKYQVTFTALLQ